jgi:hypothetical protein
LGHDDWGFGRMAQKIVWETINPNKILGCYEKDFWSFLVDRFSSRKVREEPDPHLNAF